MQSDRVGDVMEVASRLYNQPLAVQPDVLQFISWARMDLEDIETWMKMSVNPESQVGESLDRTTAGVAVIPVRGSLFRSAFFSDYDDISNSLNAALSDSSVGKIVFDIDSPGGEVRGLFDLADEIYSARGQKPMIAVANDQATSAAYAIASAADQVIASPTSTLGSIGVVAAHVDQSAASERAGFKVTEVASGANKTALSANQPLSSLGRAILEKAVDGAASQFFDLVSRNRGISVSDVEAQEAGVFFGEEAVERGLADSVGTLRSVLHDSRDSSASGQISLGQISAAEEVNSLSAQESVAVVSAEEPPESLTTNAEEAEMANPEETAPEVVEEELDTTAEEAVAEHSADPEVPDLDQARAEGRASATKEAQEIVELCTLAGFPQDAAKHIASGATVEAVRSQLLEAKASISDAEINNTVDALSTTGSPEVELDPTAIYKARREVARR